MCDELSTLRKAVCRIAKEFEPSLVERADAERVITEVASMEASLSALKAHAAIRAAEGDRWKRTGHRSPAEALARDTGTSVSSARELLEIGRRLQSQPDVDDAARRGKLSSSQLSLITNAAEADPSSQRSLIDMAERSSLVGLKEACANAKARAHPDLEERRRCIHNARSLRGWTDVDGVWRLSASGNPEDGAQVMAAIAPLSDGLFHKARVERRRDNPSAYAFDALVELARESMTGERPGGLRSTSTACGEQSGGKVSVPPKRSDGKPDDSVEGSREFRRGAPVKLLVRVDYETLLRGTPAEGETCELVGYGPISVSAVEALLETGNPFIAAVLTKAKALVGVAHLGRKPTAHQQSALEWLYPSCAAEGCPAQARLQRDHRLDWAKSHVTMLDLMDLLCEHDHGLKTREGWALVEGTGKRPFVPPDDPRHPRHSHGSKVGMEGRAGSSSARGSPCGGIAV